MAVRCGVSLEDKGALRPTRPDRTSDVVELVHPAVARNTARRPAFGFRTARLPSWNAGPNPTSDSPQMTLDNLQVLDECRRLLGIRYAF